MRPQRLAWVVREPLWRRERCSACGERFDPGEPVHALEDGIVGGHTVPFHRRCLPQEGDQ